MYSSTKTAALDSRILWCFFFWMKLMSDLEWDGSDESGSHRSFPIRFKSQFFWNEMRQRWNRRKSKIIFFPIWSVLRGALDKMNGKERKRRTDRGNQRKNEPNTQKHKCTLTKTLTHSQTHINTHKHTHKNSRNHSHTVIHKKHSTLKPRPSKTCKHTQQHSHSLANTSTITHPHTHTPTPTHTHTHTCALTVLHTNTQTHSDNPFLSPII